MRLPESYAGASLVITASSGDGQSRTAVLKHLVQVFHSGECTYLKSSVDGLHFMPYGLYSKQKRER